MKDYRDASYYEEGPVIKYLKRFIVSAFMGGLLSLMIYCIGTYLFCYRLNDFFWFKTYWVPSAVSGVLGLFWFEHVTEFLRKLMEEVLDVN